MVVRLISKLFGTLLLGTLVYCGIVWLSIRYNTVNWLPNFHTTAGGYGQMLLRMREAQQVDQTDILFVGSSHAYRGFDPREFEKKGFSSFNLGSTSQTPFNSYYLLKEFLPRMKPKVVILDMYWRMLGHDETESTIDIVSNTRIESSLMEMVANAKNGLVLNSLLINTILRTHTPLEQIKQEESPDEVYVTGGYTQSLLKQNTLSHQDLLALGPKRFQFSELQYEHLLKIIELCKTHKAQLVWVSTPVTPEYKSLVQNYDEYVQEVASLAERHQIPFIDYNQRKDLQLHTVRDFYDKDHLTQGGVKKFNQLLLKDLDKLQVHPSWILAER